MADDLHQVGLVKAANFCDVGIPPNGDDGGSCTAGVFGTGRLLWLKQEGDKIHMNDGDKKTDPK